MEKTKFKDKYAREKSDWFDAAGHGHSGRLSELAGRFARLEWRDGSGRTALHKAAAAGHYESIELLIEAGCGLELCDDRGDTPLLVAAREDRGGMICELLNAGADARARNAKGRDALALAVRSCREERGDKGWCLKLILKADPDLSSVDNEGESALDAARRLGKKSFVHLIEGKLADLEARELSLVASESNQSETRRARI